MMDLREYREQTSATVQLDELADINTTDYFLLGLAGETGELVDVVKKWHRRGCTWSSGMASGAMDELGDVLWYATRLGVNLGLDVEGFDHVARVRDMNQEALDRLAMLLFRDVAKLAAQASNPWSMRFEVRGAYSLVLMDLAAIANRLGTDLYYIAERNHAKLAERAKNGEIKSRKPKGIPV